VAHRHPDGERQIHAPSRQKAKAPRVALPFLHLLDSSEARRTAWWCSMGIRVERSRCSLGCSVKSWPSRNSCGHYTSDYSTLNAILTQDEPDF
jgi:hypothetical protein